MKRLLNRHALLVPLAGFVGACILAGCGVASAPRAHAHHTRSHGAASQTKAASQPGSGAETGTSSDVNTTAAVVPGTPPVDAIFGPPDSAISIEDVPGGDTGILASNGTPAATGASERARARLGRGYQVPADQDFNGQWFAGNSPWNLNIVGYPVDRRSSQMLRLAQERVSVVTTANGARRTEYVKDDSGLFINTVAWTTPVVQGGPETPVHCRQTPDCGDDYDNHITDLRIPRDVNPAPYYDGWFTVISPSGHWAYDLWRARRLANGSISFQDMRIWNLQGPGYGSPSYPSARGSGLPLFAGLIRPAELQAGAIDHALAISVPGPATRFYVQPASTTDGNGRTNSLPEGARIRLRAGIRIPRGSDLTATQRRYASALMWTLRNYGAIVVDRAAVPTLYGQEGVTAPLLVGNELQFLKLSDFQVVNLPPERQYPSATTQTSGAAASVSTAGSSGAY